MKICKILPYFNRALRNRHYLNFRVKKLNFIYISTSENYTLDANEHAISPLEEEVSENDIEMQIFMSKKVSF